VPVFERQRHTGRAPCVVTAAAPAESARESCDRWSVTAQGEHARAHCGDARGPAAAELKSHGAQPFCATADVSKREYVDCPAFAAATGPLFGPIEL